MEIQQKLVKTFEQIGQIVLDKPEKIKLSIACLVAGGHLLLQDLPGMGKTTLAEGIARTLGLNFNRIQFTSDMLPADILGISIFNQETHSFEFKKGPVFCQLLLADEINRSSPKTQSALLEAMEERQVSVDAITHALPKPFFVIATQNPLQQSGVYPLPESQLDRFLMCISLGYPSQQAERDLIMGIDRREILAKTTAVFAENELSDMRELSKKIYMSDVVIDYLQRLVAKSRESTEYNGLSTRGTLALKHAAQAYAFVGGYSEVTPEDIQAVFTAVVDHRLGFGMQLDGVEHSPSVQILKSVPVLSSL